MKFFIKQALSTGLWHTLDIQFANIISTAEFPDDYNYNNIKNIVLIISSAFLSAYVRAGHTCLPIYLLTSKMFLKNYYPTLNYKNQKKIERLTQDDWLNLLFSSSAVSNGTQTTPLVLEHNKLYLHRMWKDENTVAQFFNHSLSKKINLIQKNKIISILNTLFFSSSYKQVNWHKIATAISLIHSRIIISGGPGTGKTSVISKIITALLLYKNDLRIQVTATTGKASIILTHACSKIINNLKLLLNHKGHIPTLKASTLHSLLGLRLYNKINQYDYSINKLNLDYLIIDESSMISLSILSKLIAVLPKHIKIIFLGDHYQLYSVEPGSIFQDICRFSHFNYSLQRQHELTELTGYKITPTINHSTTQCNNYNTIIDGICILKQNYRFHQSSGVGQLANSIKLGDYNQSLSILTSKTYTDLNYSQITKEIDYISMITNCAKKYHEYLHILKNKPMSIIKIIKKFNEYKILCALKNGVFGIKKLNFYIEHSLNHAGLIKFNQTELYIGKPIMILHNDPSLGVYNGDIGILLPNSQNNLSAYFLDPINEIKVIQINQLPLYETCFAITIHKAQGSEFKNISIILPNEYTPILTRELIYTAVTRTHQYLSLYSTKDILINSIKNPTKRYSGLFDKIKIN